MSSDPHEKIVGLNIPMNEILGMNVLDTTNHLIGEHENCFDCESTRAEVEQIFE